MRTDTRETQIIPYPRIPNDEEEQPLHTYHDSRSKWRRTESIREI